MTLIKSNKIIHIFDDDKFIDPAIKLFESVYPGMGEYWIIKNDNEVFNYVRSGLVKRFNAFNQENFKSFVREINQLEDSNPIVFFHALEYTKQKIVLELSNRVTKVWFIWGYDLYGNWPLLKKNIFEEYTKSFIHQTEKQRVNHNLIFNNFNFWLFKNLVFFKHILPLKIINVLRANYDTIFYKAAKKIDVVVPVVLGELNILKQMGIEATYAPFTYGSIEDLLGDKIDENVFESNNILVGNSADPSNNHIEVFLKLSKMDLENRKVYVPLSYGGNDVYKDYIIRKGQELLGNNFVPLTDFIHLEKYNEILLSCSVLIFNHVRQQGVGNIIIMGYLGARIFINSKSPVYKTYKDLGIKIFNFKSLKSADLISLNKEEHELNKKLLFDLYSEEAVKNKIKELFSIVTKVRRSKNIKD